MLDKEREMILRKLFKLQEKMDKNLQQEWDYTRRMVEQGLPFAREAFTSLARKVEAK